MYLREIIPVLEGIAPPEYAVPGDRIGLQVGDPDQEVLHVAVTVDVTQGVVAEALRRRAELIVAHHPLIFDPLPSVRLDVYPQSLVYMLANSATALYVMHTNLDVADGGINDVLADRLGIVDTEILETTYSGKLFKLVVFVPGESVEPVRDALAEAGAGLIGDYTHCSFRSPGTGTFKPTAGARPYIGAVGEMEEAPEFRLEMLVDETHLHDAVTAMIAAHPYEEVAYDIYPLANKPDGKGLGRYGRLRSPMSFDGLCEMVRDVLEVEDARVCGNPDVRVEKVAVLGGSGGSRIELAHSKGVDAFITGDVNHHQCLHARALGLNLIDAGHFPTERPGMVDLTPRLHDLLSPEGVTVEYLDDITIGELS